MSVDQTLCPLCIRRQNPTITNSRLREVGATTDKTCQEHREAVERMNRALSDAYRNTRGGFA